MTTFTLSLALTTHMPMGSPWSSQIFTRSNSILKSITTFTLGLALTTYMPMGAP